MSNRAAIIEHPHNKFAKSKSKGRSSEANQFFTRSRNSQTINSSRFPDVKPRSTLSGVCDTYQPVLLDQKFGQRLTLPSPNNLMAKLKFQDLFDAKCKTVCDRTFETLTAS
jgi:hypothetical protein